MTKEERQAYLNFMYDPDNVRNCDECPENNGIVNWQGENLPCGQFHCWVAVHCNQGEGEP